jgi:hypothetical protein
MAWNDNKVHGAAATGEFLGRNYDFFTLTCVTAEANLGTAAVLDKVVEVISLNGQPVILGAVTTSGSNKILKFAIEHTGAWAAADLEAALETHGVGFANFANATVAKADTL